MSVSNTCRLSALTVALVSSAATLPAPKALAQELALEEVIVTARKREESLQETPVAVTALDATALEQAGIRNLSDLNQIAPNIEVASANGNAPLANIFIRGVGQRNTGINIDSGVGIYIDGVYVSRPDGALLDLVDIQSVQVLRGPQGTLFGKNTTGGALVFTTNKPTEEFEGMAGVRVGNYDRLDGDLVLNIPVTDQLWTRLSGAYRSRDGFIDNLFDGREYMDEDRQNVIWQTRWVPRDDFMLDLNLNWAETEQLGRPQKCVPVEGYDGWQAVLFNTIGITPATGRTLDDFCQDSSDAGGGDPHTLVSDLGGDYYSENKGASLTLEWDISDDLSLKSISAWRYTGAEQNDELDHTGSPFLHRTNSVHPTLSGERETDQYSQEFQLTGHAFKDRLHYVAGVYWFNEVTDGNPQVSYVGPYDPAISGLFLLNSSTTVLDADNEAIAVFGQVDWEFSENWRATVGLRYTDEDRELERERYDTVPSSLDANGGTVLPVGGPLFLTGPDFVYNEDWDIEFRDYTRGTTSDSDVTPMGSLQYLFDDTGWIDTGSVYLTYSEGFLSGGLSEAPTGELVEFKPEEVENWELGFKLDLMDRRLRLNGALFHTDYTNRQLTTVVINPETGNPAGATINARETTIQGFELESTWLATERLILTFNMTLNDADIEDYDDLQLTLATTPEPAADCVRNDLSVVQVDLCPNDRSSENLPRIPEETYLLAGQYNWDSSLGLFTGRLQASWKFDIDYCFDSTSCRLGGWLEDKQFDLSARITWASPNERWAAAVYGSNLTDEEYLVGGTALIESSGTGGIAVAPPRMYGAELQYRF
jgi:iron complex outermembrane receptor protein